MEPYDYPQGIVKTLDFMCGGGFKDNYTLLKITDQLTKEKKIMHEPIRGVYKKKIKKNPVLCEI